jgi:hypothetical protein
MEEEPPIRERLILSSPLRLSSSTSTPSPSSDFSISSPSSSTTDQPPPSSPSSISDIQNEMIDLIPLPLPDEENTNQTPELSASAFLSQQILETMSDDDIKTLLELQFDVYCKFRSCAETLQVLFFFFFFFFFFQTYSPIFNLYFLIATAIQYLFCETIYCHVS